MKKWRASDLGTYRAQPLSASAAFLHIRLTQSHRWTLSQSMTSRTTSEPAHLDLMTCNNEQIRLDGARVHLRRTGDPVASQEHSEALPH